jgi:hypothetical protein
MVVVIVGFAVISLDWAGPRGDLTVVGAAVSPNPAL